MPKGDADKGKADTLDGYAKVARILLEALSCAPLSGAEFQVILFIIRRTYGWAQDKNPDRGKVDVMTAHDIATGTGLRQRTAEQALGTLVKEHVVCQIPLNEYPGSQCAYGLNTNTKDWYGGPEWREAKVAFKQAKEIGSYTQNTVVPVPEKVYWLYAKICSGSTEKTVLPQALNPTGSGAEEGLQPVLQPNDSKDSSETDENDVSDGSEELAAARNAKRLRDAQRLRDQAGKLDTALAALTDTDRALLDRMIAGQAEKREKPLTLNQQATQAADYVKELTEHGPECWRESCEIACQKEIYTVAYANGCARKWQPRLGGAGTPSGQRWMVGPNGEKLYERDWNLDCRSWYDACTAAGIWDQKLGLATNDSRHPSSPLYQQGKETAGD